MLKKIPRNTPTFCFYNANPKGKRASDCVIRAISHATGKDWDSILDDLVALSHRYKIMPNEKACYNKYLEALGFTKEKQPKKYDNTKYTGKEFCSLLTKRYIDSGKAFSVIAHIGGHHLVSIQVDKESDGYKIFDIWNSSDGTIGNYWVMERTK